MQSLSQGYSELFKELFGENTLASMFPAVAEIDSFVKSKLSGKKFAEIYPNITQIKYVCNELINCKEGPIGSVETTYLKELDKLLTNYLENYSE